MQTCAAYVAGDHAVRVGETVASVKRPGEHVVRLEQWQAVAYLLRAEPFGLYAEAALERHVCLERGDVLFLGEKEHIAALAQADRLAKLSFEALEHADALDRQPDVDLAAELVADAAGALAGSALAEQLAALEDQHVGLAAKRQVVGQAGAHDAPADNDHVGVAGQRVDCHHSRLKYGL